MGVATERMPARKEKRGRAGHAWRSISREFKDPEKRTAYWMILPTTLIVLLIAAWPILYAVYLSFQRILPNVTEWVWFDNYVLMFSDGVFYTALFNTSVFTVVSVFFEFTLGLAIALALNKRFRGQGTARAIAIIPWAFPTVVSGAMWRLFYQDEVGIFAALASGLGYNGVILANDLSVLVGAIVSDVWKTTPFVALLLLAGLQTIPGDVYEAARVDGATKWQQFTRVTLPLLKPAILVALLFRTLDAWRVYDLFWSMSDRQLDSLSTYVFEFVRVSQADFSIGNAAAVFVFVSSIAIAFVFVKVFGARQEA
ncbi:MAG: carbohydrate ABC transporter permease [Actinomycetota bacterium]